MLRIDAHAHIMPESWPRIETLTGRYVQLEHTGLGQASMMWSDGQFFRAVSENSWSPARIIEDLDRHHIDGMILCTVPVLFNYQFEPEVGREWSRFLNDHLAGVQASFPRLWGFGTVPLQDVSMAIDEMIRCKEELRLVGLQIGSNIGGENLDSPRLFKFFEAAAFHEVPIMVHPWNMAGAERMKSYFMEWLVGMPAETTLAICSMLFGGVFDRLPNLRVLFSHAGGSFPFTLGRISHGWSVRPDLCNINNVSDPYDYRGKFWVDAITHDPDALLYIVQQLGADKVVYGTDYPFPLGDLEHGRMLANHPGLSSEEKELIFSGSIFKFLGRQTIHFP